VGAACAEALAREGVDVLLLERKVPAAGASGACEGNVLLADKRPGPELELSRLALAAYEATFERLDDDLELERKGALLLDASAEEHAATAALVEAMASAGVEAELLDGAALRSLEPALADGLPGGALFPGDLQVWPMKVVFALLREARRLGARTRFGSRAEAIVASEGVLEGVRVDDRPVACDVVVVAAGIESAALLASCGIALPLSGRKGQIAVTEPAPGFLRHKVIASGYAATVHAAAAGPQVATVLETTRRGNVLVGSSRVEEDRSSNVDPSVTGAMLRAARRLAPGLADLGLLRTYAGTRPALPDALPAIGRAKDVPEVIVATGHEGAGICHGPVTGALVADLVMGRRPPLDLAPFDPGRFATREWIQA
jgi:glycine/D-amino acid oxidase-like deaminating enzyme